jgi:hypothetical protein
LKIYLLGIFCVKIRNVMTNTEIEQRLSVLENEFALLKSKFENKSEQEKPWYRQIPKFGGNSAYEGAMKLGREYRESQKDFEDENDNS